MFGLLHKLILITRKLRGQKEYLPYLCASTLFLPAHHAQTPPPLRPALVILAHPDFSFNTGSDKSRQKARIPNLHREKTFP